MIKIRGNLSYNSHNKLLEPTEPDVLAVPELDPGQFCEIVKIGKSGFHDGRIRRIDLHDLQISDIKRKQKMYKLLNL